MYGIIAILLVSILIFGKFKQMAQEKGLNKWGWGFAGLLTFPVVSNTVSFIFSIGFRGEEKMPLITALIIFVISFTLGAFAVRFLYKKLLEADSKIL